MSSDSKRNSATYPCLDDSNSRSSDLESMQQPGTIHALHRESLDEVLADLRRTSGQRWSSISVTRYGLQSQSRMAAMVREFPRVPAVALLTETQYSDSTRYAGARTAWGSNTHRCRQPSGWQTLRNFLLLRIE